MTAISNSSPIEVPPPSFSTDYSIELVAFLEGLARALAGPSSTQTTFSDDDFSDFYTCFGLRGLTPQALIWTADRLMEVHKDRTPDTHQKAVVALRKERAEERESTELESSFRPGPAAKPT